MEEEQALIPTSCNKKLSKSGHARPFLALRMLLIVKHQAAMESMQGGKICRVGNLYILSVCVSYDHLMSINLGGGMEGIS